MSVDLYIIRDQAFATDIILGREFILKERLTVVYKLHDMKPETNVDVVSLFAQLPLDIDINPSEDLESTLGGSEIDLTLI